MKKLLGVFSLFLLLAVGTLSAQLPTCNNDNGLQGKIGSLLNQGYTIIDAQWYQIAYLVAPTPPFLLGTYEVTFVGPFCGIACTPVVRVERFNARVNNYQGNCVWDLSGK